MLQISIRRGLTAAISSLPRGHALTVRAASQIGFRPTASIHQVNRFDGLGQTKSVRKFNSQSSPSGVSSISDILEREIQDEMAELNQQLSTDQFPGFSVETDDSDVKLTKQVKDTTVTVRFTVSSSLSEWPVEPQSQDKDQSEQNPDEQASMNTTLVSMPEFQVQISKDGKTLELSCFFEEMEQDEETGEPLGGEPLFNIDELVIYEGEPKETEFAVSAEFFPDDLQSALLDYLSEHGIDDEFGRNLVQFATSYEKKQYVGLIKRLKSFVSK